MYTDKDKWIVWEDARRIIDINITVDLVKRFLCAAAYQSSNLLLVTCVALRWEEQRGRGRDCLPVGSVRTSLAASTLAGLSRLGVSEESREITLTSWQAVSGVQSEKRSAYNRLNGVHRHPSLTRVFVAVLVVSGSVLACLEYTDKQSECCSQG